MNEYHRYIIRKNEEFPLVDRVLKYAIKKAKEKEIWNRYRNQGITKIAGMEKELADLESQNEA